MEGNSPFKGDAKATRRRRRRQMGTSSALSIPLFLTHDWRGMVHGFQSLSRQDYPRTVWRGWSAWLSQLLGTDEHVLLHRDALLLLLLVFLPVEIHWLSYPTQCNPKVMQLYVYIYMCIHRLFNMKSILGMCLIEKSVIRKEFV